MKIRSQLFTLLAFVLLSWNASAQVRSGPRFIKKPAPVPEREFGSLQRTKLLQMGRGSGSEGAKQLGSVQRRTLLTTGKALKLPQKQRSTRRYRR